MTLVEQTVHQKVLPGLVTPSRSPLRRCKALERSPTILNQWWRCRVTLEDFCVGGERGVSDDARADDKPLNKWMKLLNLGDFRPMSEIHIEQYMTEVTRILSSSAFLCV
eukprot:GHVQ01006432.1.p1 GENE.GHVQ01006432.1~~GHVQ01006432.1.p1  ORF type:complete len:109 (+),score=5.34 GHVQ01006432.1:245-571(+)